MQKNLAVILYNIFLVGLLLTQIHFLIFSNDPCFEKVIHYVLSLYLIFRIYIFARLNIRARALNLTLTEFLKERGKYVGKSKKGKIYKDKS